MKVLLGMSGGIDSSYSVARLRAAGFEVEGAVIKMHAYTECSAAEKAAAELGVPLHEINAEALFEEHVVSNFISEYRRGRTPNPCVVCNREVKFRALADYADAHGFEKIATGHYASVVRKGDRFAVRRSPDTKKDQSYMLWRLDQGVLSRLILPLASVTKHEVRRDSAALGLAALDRPESQEICFIPDNDYPAFIERRSGKSEEGDFIATDGTVLGRHRGIIRYTLGQRKGLGIALGARAFVTDINASANTVTLSDKPAAASELELSDMVFSGLSEPPVGTSLRLAVKPRYQSPTAPALVTFAGGGRARVRFDEPQAFVSTGQSAVIYDEDGVVVAGGFIDGIRTAP